MSKSFVTAGLACALAALPGLVPRAAADHGWRFGPGIRLGAIHLTIGFVPDPYAAPTYYYRTRDHLRAGGHRCGDRCHRRGADWYHHERCPLVLGLLRHHGVHPHALFARHAPAYDGRWAGGYRDRADRHDRGRHDPYERHGRYDRHDRDDRHERDDRERWRHRDDDRRGDRGRHRGWERGRGHDRHRCGNRHHRH